MDFDTTLKAFFVVGFFITAIVFSLPRKGEKEIYVRAMTAGMAGVAVWAIGLFVTVTFFE